MNCHSTLYQGKAMRLFTLIWILSLMAMPLASCSSEPTTNDENDVTSATENDVEEGTESNDASVANDGSAETDSGSGTSATDTTATDMDDVTGDESDVTEPVGQDVTGDDNDVTEPVGQDVTGDDNDVTEPVGQDVTGDDNDVTEPVGQDVTGDDDASCVPDCDEKTCGNDGCGGQCGSDCSSTDAPVCKAGECILLIFCDAYFEQCPNDGATSDPAMLDTCKANCEQQFLGDCWFAACAVETGFCDNEEEDDASIVACGIANGWYEPSGPVGIPIDID
jgi:hypothetical protein